MKKTNLLTVKDFKKQKKSLMIFEDCVIDLQKKYEAWSDREEEELREWRNYIGELYAFVYQRTHIDFIGWQIDNGLFDWERNSWAVAKYCPHHFDASRFNWTRHSAYVAEYCPHHFDASRFNWRCYSWLVAKHCPHHIDPERFNWKEHSKYVAQYCPQYLDPTRYNWDEDLWAVESYCPHLLYLKPTVEV